MSDEVLLAEGNDVVAITTSSATSSTPEHLSSIRRNLPVCESSNDSDYQSLPRTEQDQDHENSRPTREVAESLVAPEATPPSVLTEDYDEIVLPSE